MKAEQRKKWAQRAVAAALTLLALAFSVGLTRFHVVLRRLRRGAAEERGDW